MDSFYPKFAVFLLIVGFVAGTPPQKKDEFVGNCDFDSKTFCNWKQISSDIFDWTLNMGTTPSGGTGPDRDYTSRQGKGFYAYIETSSPRRLGDFARLISGPYNGVHCLHFSYHMKGASVGKLSVFHLIDKQGTEIDIWNRVGQQGDNWLSDNVTVYGMNFYIVFEATTGSSYTGDIAIDGIYFVNGSCHGESVSLPINETDEGKCNFDFGLCDWTNDLVASDYPWHLSSFRVKKGITRSRLDHGGKLRGRFLYATKGSGRNTQSRLVSAPLCGSKCMEFFYFIERPKKSEFRVSVRSETDEDRLWFLAGEAANRKDWTRGLVEVLLANESKCYQLIFEADMMGHQAALVGLDDIHIANGSCCSMVNTPENVAKANCNFDDDSFCKWHHSPTTKFLWSIGSGLTPSGSLSGGLTGPAGDFSGSGKYAYIEASEPQYIGDTATLASELLEGEQCMRFKYHMYGGDIGTLSVYRRGLLVWQEKGNHGDQWHEALIDFDCTIPTYQVVIEASVGGWRGDIAIDEINFTVGACPEKEDTDIHVQPTTPLLPTLSPLPPPHGMCNFSVDFCDWSNTYDDDRDWIRHSGETPSLHTGPHYDRDAEGYYVYMEATNMLPGQEVRLESREFSGPMCLTFYYHMYGKDIGELKIEQRNLTDNATKVMWSMVGEQEDLWDFGLQAFYGESYKVTFIGVRGNDFLGDIGVDEIVVRDERECQIVHQASKQSDAKSRPDEANCDFEDRTARLCKWNHMSGDEFNWKWGSGTTPSAGTGPSRDHTKGNENGAYLYIESSSPRITRDQAYLLVTVHGRSICMKFWYHMNGAAMGKLEVKKVVRQRKEDEQPQVEEFKDAEAKWSMEGNQGNQWLQAVVDLPFERRLKGSVNWIAIVGTVGSSYTSDIAIDDLKFKQGRCTEKRKL